MEFIIKHRCIGYPNDTPLEYHSGDVKSKEDALQAFYESYEDLNYFIVDVIPTQTNSAVQPT